MRPECGSTQTMPETNPTIAPLYGGYANTTRHTETDPPDVAAAPPDPLIIRDRSAKQRTLPTDKPARPFVSRCFEVKLPCARKMVYIALAHRCEVWTKGTEGDVGRISRRRLAADAGLSIRKLKLQIESLVSDELVTIKRTGRTNSYIVRIPAAALALANANIHAPHEVIDPWKAAGVSRATWYRDRARTQPKMTHGGARLSPTLTRSESGSSETDDPTGGPSVDPTGGPSTEGGSVGRTKSTQRAVPTQLRTGPTPESARARCKRCEHTWQAKDGTACYTCGFDPGSTPADADARPTDDTPADGYQGTRRRNCPAVSRR